MEEIATMTTYAKCKKSRESWLGEIPEHWEEKKFKHIFSEKKKTTNVDLPCGSISFGKVVYKDDEKIPESTKRSYQVLSNGDFLINPLNLNYDLVSLRIALSDKDVVVSSGYIILNNNLKLNKDYFKWLLHIFDVVYMKTLGSGVRQTLSFTHIANCELVFPPLEEQNKMAEFLEIKTTKIDQAIAIKQQQIALLKERRQILIHKAVTRGLNDNVKLKDSGVEWIGEIPEHWNIKRFRNTFKLGKGLTITKENLADEGVSCINYGEIHSKFGFEVNPEIHKLKCVHPDYLINYSNSLLNEGDFVFADTSEDLQGSGNFTYLNSNKQVFAGYHTVIARPNDEIVSRFIAYEFESLVFRSQIQAKVKGVKVYSITQSILKELSVLVPPKNEQKEVVRHLDNSTTKIATAISLKEQEIEKLNEYKMSLIDGVVTGKVKVC